MQTSGLMESYVASSTISSIRLMVVGLWSVGLQ
jgi:hypothetical protein